MESKKREVKMCCIESSLILILCSCEISKLFFDRVPFQSNACQLKLYRCRFVDLLITKTIGQRINWKPRKGIEKNQEHVEYRCGGDCCGVYYFLSATCHGAMKCMVLPLEHKFIWKFRNGITWKRFINQCHIVYDSVENCWTTTGACCLPLHDPMKSCILQHDLFISKPVCTWKEVAELQYLKNDITSYNNDIILSNICNVIARAICQTPVMGTLDSGDIYPLATIYRLQHNTISRKKIAHVNETVLKSVALNNNFFENLLDKTALIDKFYCLSIEISMAIDANKENSYTIPNKVDGTTAILLQSDYINHLLLLPEHIFVKFLTQDDKVEYNPPDDESVDSDLPPEIECGYLALEPHVRDVGMDELNSGDQAENEQTCYPATNHIPLSSMDVNLIQGQTEEEDIGKEPLSGEEKRDVKMEELNSYYENQGDEAKREQAHDSVPNQPTLNFMNINPIMGNAEEDIDKDLSSGEENHEVKMDELNYESHGDEVKSEQAHDSVPVDVNPLIKEKGEGDVDRELSSGEENHNDVNPTERKAGDDIIDKKLSSDEDNHDDISDSNSEPDRNARLVRQKRKSNHPPVHREEHYIPFVWQFTERSPYAPGSHASASKSTIPSIKSSRMSAAQNKSQKIRENLTDTSSEDSHISVDVDLKDSFLM